MPLLPNPLSPLPIPIPSAPVHIPPLLIHIPPLPIPFLPLQGLERCEIEYFWGGIETFGGGIEPFWAGMETLSVALSGFEVMDRTPYLLECKVMEETPPNSLKNPKSS